MTDVLACREAEPTARADTSVKGKHWSPFMTQNQKIIRGKVGVLAAPGARC